MQIQDLFHQAVLLNASDLHLLPNTPPQVRVDGQLVAIPRAPALSAEVCAAMIYQLLTEIQRTILERDMGLDFAFSIEQVRYRGNIFYQRQGLQAAFRIIPSKIPTPEELMLPPVVTQLTELPRG